MSSKKLFYSKCKPQGCDAWPIAKEFRRAFVGYPVATPEGESSNWREVGCRSVFRDYCDSQWAEDWVSHMGRGAKSQVTHNRRLALELAEGSIVLVPRLKDGVCHAGVTTGPFELTDKPDWADSYFSLREENELETQHEGQHVGDIAQSWPIHAWHEIPFTAIPRWISYRLLSRNTLGIISDLEDPEESALDVIKALIEDPRQYAIAKSGSLEIGLLNWLTPSAFEHLVVSLLQLEAAGGEFWHQVGGSGDCGVDGLGVNSSGRLIGKLQCKWHYDSPIRHLVDELEEPGVKSVVAVLHGEQRFDAGDGLNAIFWNRKAIAELVQKHKDRLPFAGSLGLWETS